MGIAISFRSADVAQALHDAQPRGGIGGNQGAEEAHESCSCPSDGHGGHLYLQGSGKTARLGAAHSYQVGHDGTSDAADQSQNYSFTNEQTQDSAAVRFADR